MDTSATESENETKALGIGPTTGKKIKGKTKKEREKLFLKDKKNKKFTKRSKDKKDKFIKQKPNKLQLNRRKLTRGGRTIRKNVSKDTDADSKLLIGQFCNILEVLWNNLAHFVSE